ncbi:hypothetical protein IPL68_00945 [Candidatus Saccharibacteria bacterium]|nr:MAG: hypothetical protein IPL68_00945 [Candidatus Saccharibacteria bacterium]
MSKREVTGKVVDEIIRFGSLTATVGAMMLAPNILIALDKPLKKLYTHLDEKDRAREARRVIYYMKERGYLAGNYEHGLQLTEKARLRLERTDTEKLIAQPQKVWDRIWRIVLYDIPDTATAGRKAFQSELRRYGFFSCSAVY